MPIFAVLRLLLGGLFIPSEAILELTRGGAFFDTLKNEKNERLTRAGGAIVIEGRTGAEGGSALKTTNSRHQPAF